MKTFKKNFARFKTFCTAPVHPSRARSGKLIVCAATLLAPHLQLSFDTRQTFARLREGSFVARVFLLRANYSVSPYLTFFNFVQYDNESRDLGWQSRVRWILKPGNEVFLVFNQGWLQDERGGVNFRSSRTGLAGKMQYTLRF